MFQVLRLTGVVDDGSQLDPEVPRNTATTVSIPQFGSTVFLISCVYNSGVAVDIASFPAWKATLSVNATVNPCSKFTQIRKTGVLSGGERSILQFTLTATDTRNLYPGRFMFDCWLETPSQRWQIIRVSTMKLEPGLLRA